MQTAHDRWLDEGLDDHMQDDELCHDIEDYHGSDYELERDYDDLDSD